MKRLALAAAFFFTVASVVMATSGVDKHTLVLYLFDKNFEKGEVEDLSGNGNHGEIVDDVQWISDGNFGGAAKFDGEGHILISNSKSLDTLTDEFSIEVWVWYEPKEEINNFVVDGRNGDGFEFQIMRKETWNNSPVWWFRTPGGTAEAVGPDPFPSDGWHHLAGTYDGKVSRLYVDGKLVAEVPTSGAISTGRDILVGRTNEDGVFGPHAVYGKLDELRISNVGRKEAEIQETVEGFAAVTAVTHVGKLATTWSTLKQVK